MNKFSWLFFTFCLSFSFAQATHILGGEITYERVPNTTYRVMITVTCYTNDDSSIEFGGGMLDFGDGDSERLDYYNVVTTELYPNSNISKNVFQIQHYYNTYGNYTISYFEENRTEGILNMDNSVNTPFYIETTFVHNGNLEPKLKFLNDPVFKFYLGGDNSSYFLGEGEKNTILRYEMVAPKMDVETPVENYKFLDGVTLNGITGRLSFSTTNGIKVGFYNIAVKVLGYHEIEGEYVNTSSTIRDICILIEDGDFDLTVNVENEVGKTDDQIVLTANQTLGFNTRFTVNQMDAFRYEIIADAAIKPFIKDESVEISPNYEAKVDLTVFSDPGISRIRPYPVVLRLFIEKNGNVLIKDIGLMIYTVIVDEPPKLGNETIILNLENTADELQVFPSPANQYIRVTGKPVGASTEILNLTGKIFHKTIGKNGSIDTGDLKNGIYFLFNQGRWFKFVVQH